MPKRFPYHKVRPAARKDGVRPSSSARGYDARWERIRALIIRQRPVCQECGREPTTDVDHVVPLAAGGTHDESNLRALCHGCHSRKTVRQDGGFGREKQQ